MNIYFAQYLCTKNIDKNTVTYMFKNKCARKMYTCTQQLVTGSRDKRQLYTFYTKI